MQIPDFLTSLGVLGTIYFGPFAYFVMRNRIDIQGRVNSLLVRTKASETTCTFLTFCEYDRSVRGRDRNLHGMNRDVLHLAFPKRYFFRALVVLSLILGTVCIALFAIRVVRMGSALDVDSFLGTSAGGSTVPFIVVAFFGSTILYVITSVLCVTQKSTVERAIALLE